MEEEKNSPSRGKRYQQCTPGKGDTRTHMRTRVTLELSSARSGLAMRFCMYRLLLPSTPPGCPPPSSVQGDSDFGELGCEKQNFFFLITPVICQLLAATSPNAALPAAGSNPLFSFCFREEMDWGIYPSRASSIRERQVGFHLLLKLCYLLGSLPCFWLHLLPEQGR